MLNKEPFNFKTVQNLLDMIQNRDYIIDKLEYEIHDLSTQIGCDVIEKEDILHKLEFIKEEINKATYLANHFWSNRHFSPTQTIEDMNKILIEVLQDIERLINENG